MPSSIRRAGLAVLLLIASPPLAAGQAPGTSEPGRVMILGTYHFANPGLDVVRTEVADVLSPARQAEIRAVVEALATFRPTRVAVEHLPAAASRLDSLYDEYRAGRHQLSRDETQQIGFRLASMSGHQRVHPIDHAGSFPFEQVMQYAAANDTAFVTSVRQELDRITAEANRQQRENTVGGILRLLNDPDNLKASHGSYVRFAPVGAGDGHAGARLLSDWYERNIHIFANIRSLAGPGERVLVIIGAGHAPILRELVGYDPGLSLVNAAEYLPRD